MTIISKLNPDVVNQIAAGEVVSRPAAALKELLENALDSQATEITTEIIEGGCRRLRVLDNGCGIDKDELYLSVIPHATSKLAKLEDLDNITTMGFRGEALASIASLSSLSIASRIAAADVGYKLNLNGDYAGEEPSPHPMNFGTEVIIDDLFANVPARRKFLRKAPTEWAHCEETFLRFALACPEVHLKLLREGKLRYDLPSQTTKQRVDIVLGRQFAEASLTANYKAPPFAADIYINPNLKIAKLPGTILLNGRPLQDRMLRHAVNRAVADVSREKETAHVIYLQMPGSFVDVNAHPSKIEVRFREPQAVFKFIYVALAKTIASPLGPTRRMSVEHIQPFSGGSNRTNWSKTVPQLEENQPQITQRLGLKKTVGEAKSLVSQEQDLIEMPVLGEPIGLLHGVYLITENAKGLVFIDIHAAHERILYERMKTAVAKAPLKMQKLLNPAELDLSPNNLDVVANSREQLLQLGFEITNDVGVEMLHGYPATFSNKIDPVALVVKVIDDIAQLAVGYSTIELRDKILAAASCHAAIRGANPLNKDDMHQLIKDMGTTLRSSVCNHGRPCWQQLEIKELDRMFERGQ